MVDILTNARAPRLVRARRLLQRSKSDEFFLSEGPQAVREAVVAGLVTELFITPDSVERYPEIVEAAQDYEVVISVASAEVVKSLCSAVTPQGMVALTHAPQVPLKSALPANATLIVLLANVRDPGNAGSVIRVADAAGASGVLVSTNSVDVYNAKAVRASAGSLFHIPVACEIDIPEAIAQARALGMQVFAADGSGSPFTTGVELTKPTMWVFGNEAWGLPQEILDLVDQVVSIPIYGKAESLNLATAAAICLYASANALHS